MQRHDLEPVSLLAGLVFTVIAGCYLLDVTTGSGLHWLVALPVGLIVLGVACVTVAVRRAWRPAVSDCLPPADDVQ